MIDDAEGLRRCQTHRFPYGLIYRVESHRIVMIAVAHLRRRPGFWGSRLA